MMRKLGVLIGVTALALAAVVLPASSAPATPATAPPLPALHAEPDPVRGGRIVDAWGREVLLRGVNINAKVEYWKGTSFRTTFPFTEDDAAHMASIGWSSARLLVSWSRVEPRPGRYDEAYLDGIAASVRRLARHRIYAIIDFHQDAWGPTLAARPDEDCDEGSPPALGWDGAPGWATFDGGEPRCALGGIRELSPAVRAAFGAFWDDAPGPGGVGIRTRYVRMVRPRRRPLRALVGGRGLRRHERAERVRRRSARSAMSDLYADSLRAIRAAERHAGGHPHLMLFEPSIVWSDSGGGVPPASRTTTASCTRRTSTPAGSPAGRSPPSRSTGPEPTPLRSAARRWCPASGAPVRNGPVRTATRTSSTTSACRTASGSARRCGRGGSPAAIRTRPARSAPGGCRPCGASSRSTAGPTRSPACATTSSTS